MSRPEAGLDACRARERQAEERGDVKFAVLSRR